MQALDAVAAACGTMPPARKFTSGTVRALDGSACATDEVTGTGVVSLINMLLGEAPGAALAAPAPCTLSRHAALLPRHRLLRNGTRARARAR